MSRTSTLHFSLNNLGSKLLVNNTNTEFEQEFSDVYLALDQLSADVSQSMVDKILQYASENY